MSYGTGQLLPIGAQGLTEIKILRGPLLIRTAEASDIASMLEIETEQFQGDRISPRSFRRFVRRPTAAVLCATDRSSNIVGYVVVLFRKGSHSARIYSLATGRRNEGRGVGSNLLAAAEERAWFRNCTAVNLEVRGDNRRALTFYCRRGYSEFARCAGYYEDGQSAIRLCKARKPESKQ
jgi:ribosomal protein S18 acetylase RimI-like enzyme